MKNLILSISYLAVFISAFLISASEQFNKPCFIVFCISGLIVAAFIVSHNCKLNKAMSKHNRKVKHEQREAARRKKARTELREMDYKNATMHCMLNYNP